MDLPVDGLLRPLITRGGFGPDRIADGVWRVQGMPGRCNVYFVEDDGALVQFDAGGRSMVEQVRAAIAAIGLPLREVVLGHGHTDHRGTAPSLGVPVRCHPDDVADAEGSGGWRYWDLSKVPQPRRFLHGRILHPRYWDGGPVSIAGTVEPGDQVAGFDVVHVPGHAPGLIALVRRSDGVALTSDAFYSVDAWGRDSEPHVPDDSWNLDTEQASRSLRALADEPISVAWPGHGEPLRGDVPAQLRRASGIHE
jgi:glyoxylase-like metal-dependent hydrolase (beta-lactamase superfamily II)